MKFLIFTDNLARETEKLLNEWKHKTNQNLTWDIRPPLYPPLNELQQPITKLLDISTPEFSTPSFNPKL